MHITRTTAIITGALFIVAAVTSITGLLLYDPILNDPEYIISGSANETQIVWGALCEVLTAFAVIGTPIVLFPVLKKYNECIAISCVSFRLLEATLIIIGILSLLTIVTLNHQFSSETKTATSYYLIIGKSLVAIHNWTFLFGPNLALAPSTFMTSYVLYKSKLVPRFISILGLVGGPAVFICALLVMFGVFLQISVWGVILAIPVFFYEMSLAIWLIVKGFKATSTDY